MGDRIVVMSDAEIQQVGSPAEVYYDPANLFVARFIGSPGMNLLAGEYSDGALTLPGGNRYAVPAHWQRAFADRLNGERELVVGFRPEAASLSGTGQLVGEVYATELYGAYTMLHVRLAEDAPVIHLRSDRLDRYPIGTAVRFDLVPEMVRVFDPQTERALSSDALVQEKAV